MIILDVRDHIELCKPVFLHTTTGYCRECMVYIFHMICFQLEYTLDLTKEGYAQKHHGQANHHSYYGEEGNGNS